MANNTLRDPQIFISKEARDLFDNMRSLKEFKNFENKHFFVLAVMFGYLNKKKKPLKKQDRTKSGFTRAAYLRENDIALLQSIAINEENDIGLVNNISKVFSIAEEYANGGINDLKEFVYDNPADFLKKFASKLKKLSKNK